MEGIADLKISLSTFIHTNKITMKKLLTAVLVLAMSSAWAQSFEGVIKWSMKMEITDPAMKAKMAEGQKKMNDPAAQEKMKKMQEQMNDPKMKAMMDANPAMKAQMENAMKMQQGGGADMMNSMMPKGFTVKIKDGSSLTTVEGGMMAGDILHTPEKSVHLDRVNKTYSVMPMGEGKGIENQQKPTVTKTSETTKIAGYNCTKYVVTRVEQGKMITSNFWTTTEIKDIDLKAMAKQRMGRGQSLFYEGMEGMPLRIESSSKEGNMTMEVTEIKREPLSASDFTIPADYKETQGMFGGPR
jgi:hypothetical protein